MQTLRKIKHPQLPFALRHNPPKHTHTRTHIHTHTRARTHAKPATKREQKPKLKRYSRKVYCIRHEGLPQPCI